jgi:hypothetical protein
VPRRVCRSASGLRLRISRVKPLRQMPSRHFALKGRMTPSSSWQLQSMSRPVELGLLGLRMKSLALCGSWSVFPESTAAKVASYCLGVSDSVSLH